MKNTEKNGKKTTNKIKNVILWVAAAGCILVIIAAIILTMKLFFKEPALPEVHTAPQVDEIPFEIPGFALIEEAEITQPSAQLEVTAIGRYSGTYVEDGTEEEVTDVLALIVKNTGDTLIEYAELTLNCGEATGIFRLSALPVGSSALVMEANRLTYQQGTDYQLKKEPKCAELTSAVLDFSEEFELYPDDGVINIKNICESDISSDVCVYYKNFRYGLYIGGICYRARIKGGIAAGEVAQSMQTHYSNVDSVILYMTYER